MLQTFGGKWFGFFTKALNEEFSTVLFGIVGTDMNEGHLWSSGYFSVSMQLARKLIQLKELDYVTSGGDRTHYD